MTLTILGRPTYYYSCKRVLLERPSITPLNLFHFGTILTHFGTTLTILERPVFCPLWFCEMLEFSQFTLDKQPWIQIN